VKIHHCSRHHRTSPLVLQPDAFFFAQTIRTDLDGWPLAGSEHGIIRLLAFNYGYFRIRFLLALHILLNAKTIGNREGILRCGVEIF
jgi:hypothetical protein